MLIMTNYSFGDVVLVPFPYTEQTTTKKRPAVIVSSASYNGSRPDLILMAVTSQIRAATTVGEVVHCWLEKIWAAQAFRHQACAYYN
jgi:mRNA interferase MazF